jgi:hypothetical protein
MGRCVRIEAVSCGRVHLERYVLSRVVGSILGYVNQDATSVRGSKSTRVNGSGRRVVEIEGSRL